MSQFASKAPDESDTKPPPGTFAGDMYDLFVMNVEVGLTGIVSISALGRDDAITRYERANPACIVISVLTPQH